MSTRRISLGSLALAFVAAAVWSAVATAQQKPPQLVLDSLAGPDSYRFYCASCHGADGKGRGPVAAALKAMPADLTTVAQRNGGRFPKARLIAFVSSGDLVVAAHGSQGMPVWGPIFRGLDPSDVRTTMRIENLVTYIESIQER